jgi:hypothetical protein
MSELPDMDPLASQVQRLVDQAEREAAFGRDVEAIGTEIESLLEAGWFVLVVARGELVGAATNATMAAVRNALGPFVAAKEIPVGTPTSSDQRRVTREDFSRLLRPIRNGCPDDSAALIVWFRGPTELPRIFVAESMGLDRLLPYLAQWLEREAAVETGKGKPS